jgi:hypothetical protein
MMMMINTTTMEIPINGDDLYQGFLELDGAVPVGGGGVGGVIAADSGGYHLPLLASHLLARCRSSRPPWLGTIYSHFSR